MLRCRRGSCGRHGLRVCLAERVDPLAGTATAIVDGDVSWILQGVDFTR